ncbi:MAG: hypothetical protein PHW04_16920 [Candidatus Wallbacteria bacterium]|nr:hypothetical protein [Candidatus Wallbacteria bacterium]
MRWGFILMTTAFLSTAASSDEAPLMARVTISRQENQNMQTLAAETVRMVKKPQGWTGIVKKVLKNGTAELTFSVTIRNYHESSKGLPPGGRDSFEMYNIDCPQCLPSPEEIEGRNLVEIVADCICRSGGRVLHERLVNSFAPNRSYATEVIKTGGSGYFISIEFLNDEGEEVPENSWDPDNEHFSYQIVDCRGGTEKVVAEPVLITAYWSRWGILYEDSDMNGKNCLKILVRSFLFKHSRKMWCFDRSSEVQIAAAGSKTANHSRSRFGGPVKGMGNGRGSQPLGGVNTMQFLLRERHLPVPHRQGELPPF